MFGLDLDWDGDIDAADFVIGGMIFNEMCEENGRKRALEDAGIDEFELDVMDPDERERTLDDAGLDPDEYDYR